jgi:adenosylcobinamide-GDP ribazoletransferase
MSRVRRGLRVAVAMFSALPVPRSWHRDAAAAAPDGVLWLPLLGGGLGAVAGLAGTGVVERSRSAALLGAALSIAVLALLTRGLHLDGLADTADGLGSRAPRERALQIMAQSDIGPFGVVAIAAVLLVDVTALGLTTGTHAWRAPAALAVATATGRLAVVLTAASRVPAARPGGFGALVAGSVPAARAAVLAAVVVGGGAGLAAWSGASVAGWVVGQLAALALAALVAAHCARRIGGVTGDVFGALVEITTAATLVALALAR